MNRKIKFSIFYVIILLWVYCTSHKIITTKKINKDGLEILYGKISKEQLFSDFPDWEINYKNYKVNKSALDSLKLINSDNLSVDVFLGTWCGDSRREVPRFLKIVDETNIFLNKNINLYAVDRKKSLDNNLSQENNIQRVATFIIKKYSKEIGRIVEYPEQSLESDLQKILNTI